MPGNPLVRFDEGRVGRTARCRPLSYSTDLLKNQNSPRTPGSPDPLPALAANRSPSSVEEGGRVSRKARRVRQEGVAIVFLGVLGALWYTRLSLADLVN